jgi:hypothetical protein
MAQVVEHLSSKYLSSNSSNHQGGGGERWNLDPYTSQKISSKWRIDFNVRTKIMAPKGKYRGVKS